MINNFSKIYQFQKNSILEFGATPNDPLGSKSLYFCDNDIQKGAPEPGDITWKRPEEIILAKKEYLSTDDADELGDPMFLDGGA